MPTHTIESTTHTDGYFPDDTSIRVEWVAKPYQKGRAKGYKEKRLVWTGEFSGKFFRNFDPGKYMYKAHKYDPAGLEGFRQSGEFLVGMTEDQWRKIAHMEPKMQHASLTSDGVVFRCQFPGCTKRSSSKVSAVLHETGIHYGVDLLRSPDAKKDKAIVDEKIGQLVEKNKDKRSLRDKLKPQ